MIFLLTFYISILLVGTLIGPLFILWILIAFLFIVPSDIITFFGSTPVATIGLIGIVSLLFKKHSKINLYNKYFPFFFILLIIVSLISYLLNSNHLSFEIYKNYIFGVLKAYLFFIFSINVLNTKSNIIKSTIIFLGTAAFGGYLAFFKALNDPSAMYTKAFLGGNANTFALSLLLWLPLSVNNFLEHNNSYAKTFYLITSLGIILGITSTSGVMNTSVMIFYLIFIIFLQFFSKKKIMRKRGIVLLLVFIFGLIIVKEQTIFFERFLQDLSSKIYYGDTNRILRNNSALTLLKGNLLLGVGPGGFTSLSRTAWREISLDLANLGGSVHNLYLSILVDFGLIGSLIILLTILDILFNNTFKSKIIPELKLIYKSCISAIILFLLAGFSGGDFFNLQFWIILSLIASVKIVSKSATKDSELF